MDGSPDPLKPKRNSGRAGRRRLTAAEATLRGQHPIADHRRRYGIALPASAIPMPGRPTWFTPDLRTIWNYTLATAPPILLQAGDYDNLVRLCTAVDLYRRLARQLAEQTEGAPSAELIQQLRSIGAEVGRGFRILMAGGRLAVASR